MRLIDRNTEYAIGADGDDIIAKEGKIIVSDSIYSNFRGFFENRSTSEKISLIGHLAVAGILTFLVYELTKKK